MDAAAEVDSSFSSNSTRSCSVVSLFLSPSVQSEPRRVVEWVEILNNYQYHWFLFFCLKGQRDFWPTDIHRGTCKCTFNKCTRHSSMVACEYVENQRYQYFCKSHFVMWLLTQTITHSFTERPMNEVKPKKKTLKLPFCHLSFFMHLFLGFCFPLAVLCNLNRKTWQDILINIMYKHVWFATPSINLLYSTHTVKKCLNLMQRVGMFCSE